MFSELYLLDISSLLKGVTISNLGPLLSTSFSTWLSFSFLFSFSTDTSSFESNKLSEVSFSESNFSSSCSLISGFSETSSCFVTSVGSATVSNSFSFILSFTSLSFFFKVSTFFCLLFSFSSKISIHSFSFSANSSFE